MKFVYIVRFFGTELSINSTIRFIQLLLKIEILFLISVLFLISIRQFLIFIHPISHFNWIQNVTTSNFNVFIFCIELPTKNPNLTKSLSVISCWVQTNPFDLMKSELLFGQVGTWYPINNVPYRLTFRLDYWRCYLSILWFIFIPRETPTPSLFSIRTIDNNLDHFSHFARHRSILHFGHIDKIRQTHGHMLAASQKSEQ